MYDTDGFMTTIVSPLADQRKKIFAMDCEMVTAQSCLLHYSDQSYIKKALQEHFIFSLYSVRLSVENEKYSYCEVVNENDE